MPIAETNCSELPREAGQAPVGTARVGGIMGYAALVGELGCDGNRLISACGLDPRVFDDFDNIIPLTTAARLLHIAAKETRCPHFGLLLGQRQNTELLGPVGFLMQHSPDVRSALQNLIRYMHLHVEGAIADVAVEGDMAMFSYTIQIPMPEGAEQVYNICMANKFNFLRLLCGADWLPSYVHFPYRAPVDPSPFRHAFRVPVIFGQETSTMFFPARYLDRPVANADPNLRKILQNYIAQIESQHTRDLQGQVRRVLRTLLPTGKCTVDRVAELFSMHRRTLHRHLSAEQTTFEEMVDAARHEIALDMLKNSSISITQLAAMLGYHDTSAFTRAFRRWTGVSPSDWRGKQGDNG